MKRFIGIVLITVGTGVSYWRVYQMEAFLNIKKHNLLVNGVPRNHSAIKFQFSYSDYFQQPEVIVGIVVGLIGLIMLFSKKKI